jgi:hypothetical protein
MDLRWQEEQQAFQARVLIDDDPDLDLRPYRTFMGDETASPGHRADRGERLAVTLITGAVIVSLLLAFGLPREVSALAAGIAGGAALIMAVSPVGNHRHDRSWTPLLAVYARRVSPSDPPVCVTRISPDEFERLGTEGFGTVVGDPRPGATFGLFVDDHLVWPRTPPRSGHRGDPAFGSA